MSIFKSIKLTLFGTDENRVPAFKPHKSLIENFNNMCSLSLFRCDSPATKKLKEVLNSCKLHCNLNESDMQRYSHMDRASKLYCQSKYNDLSQVQVLQDLAMLSVARTAIKNWMSATRPKPSTRTALINEFIKGIDAIEYYLLMRHMQAHQSVNWSNPLYDININWGEHLAAAKKAHASSAPITRHTNGLHAAFLIPITNFIIDFDSFNLIFDSFNSCFAF